MQIYCPKCNAGYQIDEELIKDKSRRVKCSACGEIFTVDSLKTEISSTEDVFAAVSAAMTETEKQFTDTEIEEVADDRNENIALEENTESVEAKALDTDENVTSMLEEVVDNKNTTEETIETRLFETQPDSSVDRNLGDGRIEPSFGDERTEETDSDETVSEDDVNLEKIFERLSEQAENLIVAEKKLPFYEKIWLQIKNVLGFHFRIRWSYIILGLAIFVLLSLYNNRYQVVRKVPFMNTVYKAFGIKAKIPGEGLEFQNVGWDYVKDENGARLIVKGFVYNLTDHNIELPVVHVEILDKQTDLLQSHNREIETENITANTKIPLSMVLNNPAPTAKYVYLTFIDRD